MQNLSQVKRMLKKYTENKFKEANETDNKNKWKIKGKLSNAYIPLTYKQFAAISSSKSGEMKRK